MIITIDGPAGSGKSTVADNLAMKLDFIHFNSGSLFRGVTAYLHAQNFNFEKITIDSEIPTMELEVEIKDNIQHVYVNKTDYTPVLRDNKISTLVAHVALNKNARKIIDDCQKTFCSTHNVVMEGRDLGSHVFPNADIKFYLDCSIEERAKRRYNEEKIKGNNVSLKEIEKQIKERDFIDKNREIAPLVVPDGAIVVDSTNLTIDEVIKKMLAEIQATGI